MRKYSLKKDKYYIAAVGYDSKGVLQISVSQDKDQALIVHDHKTIKQLKHTISRVIKVHFNVVRIE